MYRRSRNCTRSAIAILSTLAMLLCALASNPTLRADEGMWLQNSLPACRAPENGT